MSAAPVRRHAACPRCRVEGLGAAPPHTATPGGTVSAHTASVNAPRATLAELITAHELLSYRHQPDPTRGDRAWDASQREGMGACFLGCDTPRLPRARRAAAWTRPSSCRSLTAPQSHRSRTAGAENLRTRGVGPTLRIDPIFDVCQSDTTVSHRHTPPRRLTLQAALCLSTRHSRWTPVSRDSRLPMAGGQWPDAVGWPLSIYRPALHRDTT